MRFLVSWGEAYMWIYLFILLLFWVVLKNRGTFRKKLLGRKPGRYFGGRYRKPMEKLPRAPR